MTFLKAYWKNIILINYEVDPKTLEPFVPLGTKLDSYNGKYFVSIVGFLFMDTKVLGIKLPYHVNFEEVNLRFYLQRNGERGVVFIKEIVPKPLITLVANSIYHEHYFTAEMKHHWTESEHSKSFEYQWKQENKWQSISVETETKYTSISEDTEEQFITEHYFGYTKHKNRTFEYEVVHPTWRQLKVKNHNINIDFENNYGFQFKHLKNIRPTSIILAEGSEVSVKNKKTIHK